VSSDARKKTELLAHLRASKWFADIDTSLWDAQIDHLSQVDLGRGDTLFQQGETGDALFLVLKGRLNICLLTDEGAETVLNEVSAGELIGEIQVLTGGSRTATVYAAQQSSVIRIAAEVFDLIVQWSPLFLQKVIETHRRRLNRSLLAQILQDQFGPLEARFLRHLESQARWVDLERNQILFAEGDPGDSVFLVLQGQLEIKTSHAVSPEQIMTRVGRGEIVGLTELFTGENRRASVRATREARLVEFSKKKFERIAEGQPAVLMTLTRMMIEQSRRTGPGYASLSSSHDRSTSLAIVPANDQVDMTEFARRLERALSKLGSTLHLCRENLHRLSGLKIDFGASSSDPSQQRLAGWLDEKEHQHRFVLYQCEPEHSVWSQKCLGQADQILVVTRAGNEMDTDKLKPMMQHYGDKDFADIASLVVVHDNSQHRPRGTAKLLSSLGTLRHHHLRWEKTSDFERIARFYNGSAVGLVLGGGGARAFSHIGVLQALHRHGIPVDMIGGTSLGSLIAAQYAFGHEPDTLVTLNRQGFIVDKPMHDLTFPFFGLVSGDRGERIGARDLEESTIEDLWLNFFAVSANLSTAQQVIHQSGSAIRAVRASMAIPGVFVPVVSGKDLLVDGGVLNNVPVDVMRQLGAGRVIGVDVSPLKDISVKVAGGRLPNARQMFWNRFNPRARPLKVPGLFEILMRASTLGSIQNTEMAKSQADLYINPPLDEFGTFDLKELDKIVEAGYLDACRQLAGSSFL